MYPIVGLGSNAATIGSLALALLLGASGGEDEPLRDGVDLTRDLLGPLEIPCRPREEIRGSRHRRLGGSRG